MAYIRLTTDAARKLHEELDGYFDMVRSSGLSDESFEAAIETPVIDLAEPKAIDDVRVKLVFAR